MIIILTFFVITSAFCATPADPEIFKGRTATWHLSGSVYDRDTYPPGIHVFCAKHHRNPFSCLIASILYQTIPGPTDVDHLTSIWQEVTWEKHAHPQTHKVLHSICYQIKVTGGGHHHHYKYPAIITEDNQKTSSLTIKESTPYTETFMRKISDIKRGRQCFLTITCSEQNLATVTLAEDTRKMMHVLIFPNLQSFFPKPLSFKAYQAGNTFWVPFTNICKTRSLDSLSRQAFAYAKAQDMTGGYVIAYHAKTPNNPWETHTHFNGMCLFHTIHAYSEIIWLCLSSQTSLSNPNLLCVTVDKKTPLGTKQELMRIEGPRTSYLNYGFTLSRKDGQTTLTCKLPVLHGPRLEISHNDGCIVFTQRKGHTLKRLGCHNLSISEPPTPPISTDGH